MNIVVAGPKGAGKSAVGAALSELTGLPAVETDHLIESSYGEDGKTYREIFAEIGEAAFRDLEHSAAEVAANLDWHIIITGGGTLMNPDSRRLLRARGTLVLLDADVDTLWERATKDGVPSFLEGPDGRERFEDQVALRMDVLRPYADAIIDTAEGTPEEIAEQCGELIGQDVAVRSRSANTFGELIRVTSFGESHGTAIGCILEGVRPGIEISDEIIQKELDRRRPGQSKVVTQRKEPDTVQILSGVFEGKTTGTPIGMVIFNQDHRSSNYDAIKDLFRPGHADFTFYKKYGLRDHRGGGRSSARETAMRVAAGAIAMEFLRERGVSIHAHAVEIGGVKAETCDHTTIEDNVVRCADPVAAKAMEEAILTARKDQDSVGGIIRLDIDGVPAGLGDPIFGKLDARLTYAIMTIMAIKGVEIGDGFALTRLRGSEANDNMTDGDFDTNHAGGILGGISNGQRIVMRVAVKPTASISSTQHTMDLAGENREIEVGGRHDPCIVPRAVPVIEHMAALVLMDAWEIQSRINPDWPS